MMPLASGRRQRAHKIPVMIIEIASRREFRCEYDRMRLNGF
jgi:hypothetical protein